MFGTIKICQSITGHGFYTGNHNQGGERGPVSENALLLSFQDRELLMGEGRVGQAWWERLLQQAFLNWHLPKGAGWRAGNIRGELFLPQATLEWELHVGGRAMYTKWERFLRRAFADWQPLRGGEGPSKKGY